MPPRELGRSFLPGGEETARPSALQRAIQILSLRLPERPAERGIAPAPLLQQGPSGGLPAVISSLLQMLSAGPASGAPSAPTVPGAAGPVSQPPAGAPQVRLPEGPQITGAPTPGARQEALGEPERLRVEVERRPQLPQPRIQPGAPPPPQPNIPIPAVPTTTFQPPGGGFTGGMDTSVIAALTALAGQLGKRRRF